MEGHPDFLRIHGACIVNKNGVLSIKRGKQQHKFFVEMANSDHLELSFTRKQEILAKLAS